jgi:fructose-1,6-bisphosphatase/inositol monophosphatase family enzyme
VIDPIDGTKAFTRGVPLYSNLLAVLDDHGPVIGVINLPALGTTVYAGRGLGCFRDGRPVRVSERDDPNQAVISSSSYSWWPEDALLGIKRGGYQMRSWGDGYGYALVACGSIEVMVDPEVSHWDVAPLPVIIGEAGGRISALDGGEAVLTPGATSSFVASNGRVHDHAVAAMNPASSS